MGRIADAFERAHKEKRAALVIYICAGDPDLTTTAALIPALAEAGADVIELGMPFSDPTADGPAIQQASERALRGGATLAGVLETVKQARQKTEVPILLFGYYNPILRYGELSLVDDASDAGADGFLVVDLPPEEAGPLREAAIKKPMDFVPLIAPTSHLSRVKLAAESATSFVYYVSMTGVTGAQAPDLEEAARRASILEQDIKRPIAMGFGIKTPEDVAKVAPHVSGVVVGSAVVRAIKNAASPEEAIRAASELVRSLAAATHRVEVDSFGVA